jgi:hypothetical protein
VFTNLTPFIPSPSKERGKRFIERGETPLLPALPLPLLREGVKIVDENCRELPDIASFIQWQGR